MIYHLRYPYVSWWGLGQYKPTTSPICFSRPRVKCENETARSRESFRPQKTDVDSDWRPLAYKALRTLCMTVSVNGLRLAVIDPGRDQRGS